MELQALNQAADGMFGDMIHLGTDYVMDIISVTCGEGEEEKERDMVRRFRLTEFGGGEFVSKFPDLPARENSLTSEEVAGNWERDIQGPDRGCTSSAAAYAKVVLEPSLEGNQRSGVATIDAQIEDWWEDVDKLLDEDKVFAPTPNYGDY